MKIRKAQKSDVHHGARLILLTLGNSGEALFGNSREGQAIEIFEQLFCETKNRFSYKHAYFSEADDKVSGLLLVFPGSLKIRLMTITGIHMLKFMGLFGLLKFIMTAFPLRNEEDIQKDEFFIAHLAVYPDYQRQGYGWQLLDFAEKRARDYGFSKLALNSDVDNLPAIALYKKYGFLITKKTLYPQLIKSVGSRGSVKMIKEI